STSCGVSSRGADSAWRPFLPFLCVASSARLLAMRAAISAVDGLWPAAAAAAFAVAAALAAVGLAPPDALTGAAGFAAATGFAGTAGLAPAAGLSATTGRATGAGDFAAGAATGLVSF